MVMNLKEGILVGGVVWSVLGVTACSSSDGAGDLAPEADVDGIEQLLGSASCAAATANLALSGAIDPEESSPAQYDNCFRSYVVDVFDYLPSYTEPLPPGVDGSLPQIQVVWASAPPTTKTACENAWGAAILYKWVGPWIGGHWEDITGVVEQYGLWDDWGSGFCFVPLLVLPGWTPPLEPWASYRIAATMRTRYGGSTLRQIEFKSYKAQAFNL